MMMSPFQCAALAVVEGDLATLKSLMDENHDLVLQRSSDHGATLLHYVSANGPVEDDMQKTPPNAMDIARYLIAGGCHVDAVIDDEPASTPLVGLVTSEFPAEAGLQGELVELFLDNGAAVNGLNDDGYPLACALCFQYPDAISALVKGGARIDNIVSAASLGDIEFVRKCFNRGGHLRPEAIRAYPEPFMREFGPGEILETAIEHATHYQQHEVAEFLANISRNTSS